MWAEYILATMNSSTSARPGGAPGQSGCLVLMAPQTGIDHEPFRPGKIAKRMGLLHRQVAARGHTLRFLSPSRGSNASLRLRIVCREVERLVPAALFPLRIDDPREEYHLRWPKDAVQDFTTAQAVAETPVARRIARRLRLHSALPSGLCEGGLMARAGDVILASSAMPRHLLGELPGHLRCFLLPEPFESGEYRQMHGPAHCRKTHLDLDVGLLRSHRGEYLLLVAELYRRVYRKEVEDVTTRLNASVFVVPQDEVRDRALNCVFLPPGDVLVPSACLQTRRFLAHHLGRRHVIPVRIDRWFNYNGGHGGLGCMSTVIQAPVDSASTGGAPGVSSTPISRNRETQRRRGSRSTVLQKAE